MRFRIICYCSSDYNDPDLKMYWNKRLNKWTFNNPTIVDYIYAWDFITSKYSKKDYIETNDEDDSINYYLYGLEIV